jgi:RND family efflux transporter MFP subunit
MGDAKQPPHDLSSLRIEREERGGGSRGRLGPWAILALAVVVVAAAGWWWASARAVASVTVAPVREQAGAGSSAVLNASGYVTARRRATISAKITGKVTEVHVEEGMAIREGQVLARLDDSLARRALALEEAQRDSAKASLAETEARLTLAAANLRRTSDLVAKEVSSKADLDAAKAEHDALAARLGFEREQVKVAERGVAIRSQEVEDTVVRAPFGGVVVSKDAQPGEMISPISAGGGFTRTGICTVVDMTSLEIEVDVNESYIQRVEAKQRVEAILDAYPDWRIPASVIAVIPTADRQKATVRVRIAFDGPDPRILPDMGVKVAFLSGAHDGARASAPRYYVPRAAVRRDGDRDVVFVLANGRVERRAVKTGTVSGSDVEIVGGVAAGERVVVEGPQSFGDGARAVAR